MKKILNLGLIATAVLSFSAMADGGGSDPVKGQLVDETLVTIVGEDGSASIKNSSQSAKIIAIKDREGFVKNDFEITVSANVGIAALDENTRFGVIAGANRGRAVFTGTSEGGSVTQCGDLVEKNEKDGGASLVTDKVLVLDNPNGCEPAKPTSAG